MPPRPSPARTGPAALRRHPETHLRLSSALLVLSALFSSCGLASGSEAPRSCETMDLAGVQALLEPRSGDEALVLNLWATWCPPCVAEMPELVELHREGHQNGVRVVALSLDLPMPTAPTSADDVCSFASGKDFDLPVVVFDGTTDDLRSLAQELELDSLALPQTLVWNSSGERVALKVGKTDLEGFRELVAKARTP